MVVRWIGSCSFYTFSLFSKSELFHYYRCLYEILGLQGIAISVSPFTRFEDHAVLVDVANSLLRKPPVAGSRSLLLHFRSSYPLLSAVFSYATITPFFRSVSKESNPVPIDIFRWVLFYYDLGVIDSIRSLESIVVFVSLGC